jgi:polyisoprenoid-binding protein YceI
MLTGRQSGRSALIAAGAVLLAARPARAEMLHMEADVQKSEIRATVAEPLGLLRDHPNATGTFRLVSGEIDGDPENPTSTGHVKLVVDATSYNSGDDRRDRAVIHSALETAKYQTITFESKSFNDVSIDVPGVSGSATVVGNLSMHGMTRPMRVPNVLISMSTDGEFSAGGEFSLRYTDFGVNPPRLLYVLPVSSDVTLSFRIVAQRPGSEAAQQQSRREPKSAGAALRLATTRLEPGGRHRTPVN